MLLDSGFGPAGRPGMTERDEAFAHDEARLLPLRDRPPHRVVARPRRHAERQPELQALHRHHPDRRARAVRLRLQRRQQFDLRARRPGHLEAHHGVDAARAADAARRARGGDEPYRPDLDRDHHLSRPVPCGAHVRDAGPDERGPGRLERGDLVGRIRGAELQPPGARAARPALRARRRIHPGCAGPLGYLGGRRPRPGPEGAACSSIPKSSTCCITRASTSRCAGR